MSVKNWKITRVASSAVAGTSAVNSSIIDMAGFDGVVFVALIGDVTATCVLGLKIQENSTNATGGMTDLTTPQASYTAGATDADNTALVVDAVLPPKEFLRAVLTRTTANAVVDGIIAIQYKGKSGPTSQDATVIANAYAANPTE